jgi:nucleoid-associated protein YgaU
MAAAQASYKAKEYPASTEASKKVIELLAGVQPRPKPVAVAPEPLPPPPPPPAPEPAQEPEKVLPATYIVRLIPERRDCFWRIAEYPFVYGDPLKWPILYEANKNKIPQPDNPHLILPDMEVTIPSIDGEKREGVWSPEEK